MKNGIISINNWIIRILLIINTYYIVHMTTFGENGLGVYSTLRLGLIFVCIVVYFIKGYIVDLNDTIFIAIFTCFISLINVFLRSKGMNGLYFHKVLRFCSILLLIGMIGNIKIDKCTINIFFICNQVLTFLFIDYGLINAKLWVINDWWTEDVVTLGFTNPNMAGMWIFSVISVNIYFFFYFKEVITRIGLFFEITTLGTICIKTNCRSAQLAIISLVFLYLICQDKFNRAKIFTKIMWFITLIFPFVYIISYLMNLRATILGSNIYSGRELMWPIALKYWSQHFLLGAYYEISNGSGVSQMHNVNIDVLSSYGIVVFIAFNILLYATINRMKQHYMKKQENVISLLAFSSSLIIGCFEAAFVSGDAGFYAIWPIIMLMIS